MKRRCGFVQLNQTAISKRRLSIMAIFRQCQHHWLLLLVGFLVLFEALRGADAAANGRFQFTQAVYSTTEDFGVAYITVQRSLGSDGRAAVYVSTIPGVGTAVAGRDYKPLFNVSLVWQDGEDFEKAIYLPIYNDGKPQESPKIFMLKLHDSIGADINPDRNRTQVVLVPPSNRELYESLAMLVRCKQLTITAFSSRTR